MLKLSQNTVIDFIDYNLTTNSGTMIYYKNFPVGGITKMTLSFDANKDFPIAKIDMKDPREFNSMERQSYWDFINEMQEAGHQINVRSILQEQEIIDNLKRIILDQPEEPKIIPKPTAAADLISTFAICAGIVGALAIPSKKVVSKPQIQKQQK